MSKHTPGPWEARGAGVFAVGRYIGATGDEDSDGDEQVANARLMAVAPEMLDALKMCADWMDAREKKGAGPRVVDAARLVIAKAEGRR